MIAVKAISEPRCQLASESSSGNSAPLFFCPASSTVLPTTRASPLVEIARHLGEPEQRSPVVAYRRDHHVRPEAGAVFANAPVLLLVPSLCGGGPKRRVRLSGGDVFRSVEAREWLADDLLGSVPL